MLPLTVSTAFAEARQAELRELARRGKSRSERRHQRTRRHRQS